jgi:hypothetical protein
MPTIKFVVDGEDRVVDADRVMRDSQQYVAERREAGRWLTVAAWPRRSVSAVLRQLDGPQGRWFPEDVRTSAGLEQQRPAATEGAQCDALTAKPSAWAGLLTWRWPADGARRSR